MTQRHVPLLNHWMLRTILGLLLVVVSPFLAAWWLGHEPVALSRVLAMIVLGWLPAIFLTDKYVHKYPQRYATYLVASHAKATVIMAILASVVIPNLGATADHAKESMLISTTHTLRSQIEIYKNDHGAYPSLSGDSLPQLVTATDVTGAEVADGPFGPYFDGEIPPNPVDQSNRIYPAASAPPR